MYSRDPFSEREIGYDEAARLAKAVEDELGVEWLHKQAERASSKQAAHPIGQCWLDLGLFPYHLSGKTLGLLQLGRDLLLVRRIEDYEFKKRRLKNAPKAFLSTYYELHMAGLFVRVGHDPCHIRFLNRSRTPEFQILFEAKPYPVECKTRQRFADPVTFHVGQLVEPLRREFERIQADFESAYGVILGAVGHFDPCEAETLLEIARDTINAGEEGLFRSRSGDHFMELTRLASPGEVLRFKQGNEPSWFGSWLRLHHGTSWGQRLGRVMMTTSGSIEVSRPRFYLLHLVNETKADRVVQSFQKAREKLTGYLAKGEAGIVCIDVHVSEVRRWGTSLYIDLVSEAILGRMQPGLNTRVGAVVLTFPYVRDEILEGDAWATVTGRLGRSLRNPHSMLPVGLSLPFE